MRSGIIRINGLLYKITEEGRFRRHWKGEIRTKDSRMYRQINTCPECGVVKKLTVDHYPPLRESIDNPKTKLLCWDCHSKKNAKEAHLISGAANYIQNCGKGHNTYLRPDLTIYCRKCRVILNQLKQIGPEEYVGTR
jgi:5-methylcytosine-specific restriction endonuclease McrA